MYVCAGVCVWVCVCGCVCEECVALPNRMRTTRKGNRQVKVAAQIGPKNTSQHASMLESPSNGSNPNTRKVITHVDEVGVVAVLDVE
jgi:hypothetical protein